MRAVGIYKSPLLGDASSGVESGYPLPRGPVGDEAIRDYCAQFHHNLVETFADNDGDKNYAGLIARIGGPAGRPALVIIPDSTHLADDLESLVERLLEVQATGSEVRCLDSDYPDLLQNGLRHLSLPGRSAGSLRRIREAILAKASRGEVLGRTPYGYWAGLDGQLKVDEAEAAVVRHMFDAYAGPPPAEGLPPAGGQGLRKIASGLNEQGRMTRKGRPWTPVAIAGVLRNRVYVGTYTRYGVRISGSHRPLVDRARFNLAQQVLENRKPVRRAPSAEPYLLGGLARCALCGQGVFGLTRKRSWKRKDGEKVDRIYRYYECPGGAGPGSDKVEGHASWRATELEGIVRDQLLQLAKSGRLSRAGSNFENPIPSARNAATIATAEREFMKALRSVASGHGSIVNLTLPLANLRGARAADAKGSGPRGDAMSLMEAVTGQDMSIAREAMSALLERVVVSPQGAEIELRKAPAKPPPRRRRSL